MREQKGINATTFTRRASLPAQYRTGQVPASPHRSGHHPGIHPEDMPYTTSTRTRYKPPVPDDDENEEAYPQRTRSSAIVYRQPYTHVAPVRHTEELEQEPRRGKHPIFYIGVSMLIALAFITAYISIPPAWQRHVDDTQYGYPRTFQTDANVGHGGVSHFIVVNMHGTIEVVEIPGNPAKNQPRLYLIVRFTNQGADLVPATVSFPDINGDGKPDMQVTVYNGTNPTIYVLFNDGTMFKPHP